MTTPNVPAGFQPVVPVGFNAHIGPILRDPSRKAGEAGRFHFTPLKHHLNAGHNVHGGVLMTLCDIMLGYTVHEAIPGKLATTATLNTDFLSGAREGEVIEGRAEVTRLTRSLVFVGGDLSVAGKTVMTASGIWKIIGERKDSALT